MIRSGSSLRIMSRDNKQNMSCRMNKSTKDHNFQSKNNSNTSLNFNNILAWSSMGKGKGKENRRGNQEIVSTIEETQRNEDYVQDLSRVTNEGNRSAMANCLISNINNCKNSYNLRNNHQSQRQKRLKILTQSDLTDDNYYNDLSQQLFSQRTTDQQQMVLKSYNTYYEKYLNHPKDNDKKTIYRNIGIKGTQQYQLKQRQVQQEVKEQVVDSPPFILIANSKLQVKNYHPIIKTTITLFSLISLRQPNPSIKAISKLTITNCFLQSLQGIECFQQLEQLNLRKNELRQVQQLYKIRNKQKVTMINIQGNDIEYYNLASYTNLKKVFLNLVQLNDKNYGVLDRKAKKYCDMRNVLKKSTKLECQFKNDLKKEIKRTDRAMIRYNPSAFAKCKYQQQIVDEQFNEEETFKKNTNHNHNHNNENYNQLSLNTHNRKSKCLIQSNNYIHQMSNNNKSDCQEGHYSLGQQPDGQSFKKDVSLQVGRQLSLASIDNVPLTKSLNLVQPLEERGNNTRCNKNNNRVLNKISDKQNNGVNINSNRKLCTKSNQIPLQTLPTRGLLEIKTQNLDDENEEQQFHNNSHLHQPTATFAMQLQKQQQYALQNKQFMFRNNVNKKPNLQNTTKLSRNSNTMCHTNTTTNKSLVLMIDNNDNYQEQYQQSYNRQIAQQQQENEQITQQNELMVSYGGNRQSMSLSQISEIPTKRERRVMSNNNRKSLKNQQQLYTKDNNINGEFIHQEQSFTTTSPNEYFAPNKNNTLLNYNNNSCLAYSQFTQYKPNQSMDDDCLLKQNKNSLQLEKLAIATAIYMRNLATKSLYALSLQSSKRKNLPKRKQHLFKFVN